MDEFDRMADGMEKTLKSWFPDYEKKRKRRKSVGLLYGRFAVGYEWYTKSKKRRFVQLTGLYPTIFSVGFKF